MLPGTVYVLCTASKTQRKDTEEWQKTQNTSGRVLFFLFWWQFTSRPIWLHLYVHQSEVSTSNSNKTFCEEGSACKQWLSREEKSEVILTHWTYTTNSSVSWMLALLQIPSWSSDSRTKKCGGILTWKVGGRWWSLEIPCWGVVEASVCWPDLLAREVFCLHGVMGRLPRLIKYTDWLLSIFAHPSFVAHC